MPFAETGGSSSPSRGFSAKKEKEKEKKNPFLPSLSVRELKESEKVKTLPKTLSQTETYLQKQEDKRNSIDPKNPFLKSIKDNTVDLLGQRVDQFLIGDTNSTALNAIGKFTNRLSRGMGDIQNVDTQLAGAVPKLSTGSKIADKAADLIGMGAGALVDPSNIGGGFLSKTAQAGRGFADAIAPKANNLVRNSLAGAVEGGLQGAALSGTRGETDLSQVALSSGLGLVGGAVAAPLLSAAGQGIKRGFSTLNESTGLGAQAANNLSDIQPLSSTLGPSPGVDLQSAPVQPAEAMKSNWFTSLFGNKGVGITAGQQPTRRNLATTEGQIVDNPLKRDAQGLKDQAAERIRATYQDNVDFTNPLKYISRETYETAQDARRANNLANTSVQDKFVDLQGNVVGSSLKETMQKVARGEGHAFEDYLILRHAKTRMSRGERVYDDKLGMTPQKVDERIAVMDRRYPQFTNIAKEWDGYNDNLLRIGVQEGLISEAQRAAMREANPNYASMRRQFSTSEKFANPLAKSSRGFSGQKAPIKEVSPTGSTRKIISPVRSAIEQTGAWYNAAMRNRVMQSLVDRVQSDPEALKGIVEIVPDVSQASQKSLDEINDILKADGVEGLIERLDEELEVFFRKGGQKGAKTDNIVTAMRNGNPVKLRVQNPEIFKALVGLGPEQSNLVMDFIGGLSNATKYGATGALAPLFAARSLTTDIGQAIIQSKQPLTHLGDFVHAMVSSIANKMPQGTPGLESIRSLAQDFSRTGGEYSAALMSDRALNQSMSGLIREPFLSPRGLGQNTLATVKAPFKALNTISDISENVNRMAAYQGALRRAGGQRTPENIRNAMRESQEITTNFSRKGSKSQSIEKFVPYNNAAVQGIRRFAKQFKENPVKTAALVGGTIVAPKIYEYAMFSDDPDYQKIPAREKYRNMFVKKNDDGTFIKVPMSPEYNAIGAGIIDILTAYKDGDPVNWRQSADAIVNAYTPPWLSGALQGVTLGGGLEKSIFGTLNSTSLAAPIAVSANQSFTGAPIVPRRLETNSPKQQFDERTSDVAKKIGQTIGLSPIKADYLLKAYGGDPARLLLPLTSDVGAGTPKTSLLKNFISDPVFTNTLSTDYYNMKTRITQAQSDSNTNGTSMPKWYKEDVAKAVTSQAKESITKKLTNLSGSKRQIQSDRSLSAKDKAEMLRDLQAQMNDLYLDGITRMKAGGVPTGR